MFVTGYAENLVLNNGSLAPRMGVIRKPFSIHVIPEPIRSMIDSSSRAFREYKKLSANNLAANSIKMIESMRTAALGRIWTFEASVSVLYFPFADVPPGTAAAR